MRVALFICCLLASHTLAAQSLPAPKLDSFDLDTRLAYKIQRDFFKTISASPVIPLRQITNVQTSESTTTTLVIDEKGPIQENFDKAIDLLYSLIGEEKLHALYKDTVSEMGKRVRAIRRICYSAYSTAADLAKANSLISELNFQIADLQKQTPALTNQHHIRTADVPSELNASNFQITLEDADSYGPEGMNTHGKKGEMVVIIFDIDNRIESTGHTDVYVCITAPDGKTLFIPFLVPDTIATREYGNKPYTAKVPIDFDKPGKKIPVRFGWKQDTPFARGVYTIRIYHNGFNIGEGKAEFKEVELKEAKIEVRENCLIGDSLHVHPGFNYCHASYNSKDTLVVIFQDISDSKIPAGDRDKLILKIVDRLFYFTYSWAGKSPFRLAVQNQKLILDNTHYVNLRKRILGLLTIQCVNTDPSRPPRTLTLSGAFVTDVN